MAIYCSPGDLRGSYRLGQEGGKDDQSLSQLLTTASRWIDRSFDLPDNAFAQTTDTTRYLSHEAVLSPSLLRLDVPLLSATTITNGNSQVINPATLMLVPRGRPPFAYVRLITGTWQADYVDEIVITGRFGYSAAAPDLIREATAMLATWLLDVYQAHRNYESPTFDEAGKSTKEIPFPAVETLLHPIRLELQRLRR